jgi:hypothetical protein
MSLPFSLFTLEDGLLSRAQQRQQVVEFVFGFEESEGFGDAGC